MIISKLASAIRNDIVSGLQGYHANMSMNLEQLEDEIVEMRLQIIKEYSLKGILPIKDLLQKIPCIDVTCSTLEQCLCCNEYNTTNALHFTIPQLINDFEGKSIQYIGGIDGISPFIYYTTPIQMQQHKYRIRGRNKPYVWINNTPNHDGLLDCYIFNAPLIKKISIVAAFKDPRQLEEFGCCESIPDDNLSFIDTEIKERLTKQKISYYRQLANPITPNTQTYHAG